MQVETLQEQFSEECITWNTSRAVENDEDIVDSDFSIDEDDEVVSDHEADAEFKRKRTVGTKAYKEPVKPKEKSKAVEKKPKSPKKKVKTSVSFTELGMYFIIFICILLFLKCD